MRWLFSELVVLILLMGTLTLAFDIQPVKANGTIYIRADGSIDPPNAPISTFDNVTYTLTGNITSDVDGIVIERNNTIFDGAGYTIKGMGTYPYSGISLSGKSNVTIKSTSIEDFGFGIHTGTDGSSNNSIIKNNIANNGEGIWFGPCSNNSISGNNIVNNSGSIYLEHDSNSNSILGNNVTNNGEGIWIWESSNNTISGNNIVNNSGSIYLHSSFGNSISGNSITNNSGYGSINLRVSSNNSISGNDVAGSSQYGIYLEQSSNYNSVVGNNVTTKGDDGICLVDSSSNSIGGNSITNSWNGIYFYGSSSYNSVSGNGITNNSIGIFLFGSSNNSISGNNVAGSSQYGIYLEQSSNYNSISLNVFLGCGLLVSDSYENIVSGNMVNGKPLIYLEDVSEFVVTDAGQVILVNCSHIILENLNLSNATVGVQLYNTTNTIIMNNNVTNNSQYGIFLIGSSNNRFFHNNFTDNTQQVHVDTAGYANVWDDGYPSGGNYWSDYAGTDANHDGIGDTQYNIDGNNRDRYPLINPWNPQQHDLSVSIPAPVFLQLGTPTSLDATVTNNGLNDEVDVEFLLLMNDTTTNSTIIPLLQRGDSYTLSCLWTPTVKGKYNLTAYARPVPGETSLENNEETNFVTISPPLEIGVKTGDWVKYDYTITGAPSGTPLPQWLKVEFLSVVGTNATVRVTMHMSDGTEQNATVPLDIVVGGQALGLSGFVIPANLTTGDVVCMSGYGNITIAGETTRSYSGASRTVGYASFSQYWTQLTYYWDEQTGVMVEASTTSGTITGTGKATETNMWQAAASGLPIEPIYLYVLAALAIIIVVGATVFIMRRRKKPPEEIENSQSKTAHTISDLM